jgi:hypothetical protein
MRFDAIRIRLVRHCASMLSIALVAGACTRVERVELATPVATSGPAARELLARPGFAWQTVTTPIARIHTEQGSKVQGILPALIDSIDDARRVALRTLREPEIENEPKLELFLVDTREDMQRLMGRPIGGFAQPGELTAAFVAGPGYRPFLRHELTHAYASVRWGQLVAGEWLTEGLAALAQGACQGHEVDALAAGYQAKGEIPPLRTLTKQFRDFPELPSYLAAASVMSFMEREADISAIRALWRGTGEGVREHPLGKNGEEREARWRAYLGTVAPAALDSARLRHEGC